MSSGKSSPRSTTAVLLLLALLAVGTCAPGAQAQFDITNLCNKTVVLTTNTNSRAFPLASNGTLHKTFLPTTNTNSSAYRLAPNETLHRPESPRSFFVPNVTITIQSIPSVNITIREGYVYPLWTPGTGGRLVEIAIVFNNNTDYCIDLPVKIEYTVAPNFRFNATGLPFNDYNATTVLGPFCP